MADWTEWAGGYFRPLIDHVNYMVQLFVFLLIILADQYAVYLFFEESPYNPLFVINLLVAHVIAIVFLSRPITFAIASLIRFIARRFFE